MSSINLATTVGYELFSILKALLKVVMKEKQFELLATIVDVRHLVDVGNSLGRASCSQ